MAETQLASREAFIIRYQVGRPALILGIACAVLGGLLYETVVAGAIERQSSVDAKYVLAAAGVLVLLAAPLVLQGLAWEVRASRAALAFSVVGFLLCIVATALVAASASDGFDLARPAAPSSVVLILNVYGIGVLSLLVATAVGHDVRRKRLRSLAAALIQPATPTEVPALPRPTSAGLPVADRLAPRPLGFSGEVHDVSEIPGIDEDYARQLRSIGVTNTAQLLARTPDAVADQTGISEELVRSWRGTADLLRLRTLTPETAAVLYRCGVHDVAALAAESPKRLADRIRRVVPTDERPPIDGRATEPWIREARSMSPLHPVRRRRPQGPGLRRRRPQPTRSRSHAARH